MYVQICGTLSQIRCWWQVWFDLGLLYQDLPLSTRMGLLSSSEPMYVIQRKTGGMICTEIETGTTMTIRESITRRRITLFRVENFRRTHYQLFPSHTRRKALYSSSPISGQGYDFRKSAFKKEKKAAVLLVGLFLWSGENKR